MRKLSWKIRPVEDKARKILTDESVVLQKFYSRVEREV